jgi:hypothetical protein
MGRLLAECVHHKPGRFCQITRLLEHGKKTLGQLETLSNGRADPGRTPAGLSSRTKLEVSHVDPEHVETS